MYTVIHNIKINYFDMFWKNMNAYYCDRIILVFLNDSFSLVVSVWNDNSFLIS